MKLLLSLILVVGLVGCKDEPKENIYFISYRIYDYNNPNIYTGNYIHWGDIQPYDSMKAFITKSYSCDPLVTNDDIEIVGLYRFADSLEYNLFRSNKPSTFICDTAQTIKKQ